MNHTEFKRLLQQKKGQLFSSLFKKEGLFRLRLPIESELTPACIINELLNQALNPEEGLLLFYDTKEEQFIQKTKKSVIKENYDYCHKTNTVRYRQLPGDRFSFGGIRTPQLKGAFVDRIAPGLEWKTIQSEKDDYKNRVEYTVEYKTNDESAMIIRGLLATLVNSLFDSKRSLEPRFTDFFNENKQKKQLLESLSLGQFVSILSDDELLFGLGYALEKKLNVFIKAFFSQLRVYDNSAVNRLLESQPVMMTKLLIHSSKTVDKELSWFISLPQKERESLMTLLIKRQEYSSDKELDNLIKKLKTAEKKRSLLFS